MLIDVLQKEMYTGDYQAIIKGLEHPGYSYRVTAILAAVKNKKRDPGVERGLQRLKTDDSFMLGKSAGFQVSTFAKAALHILEFEIYEGNDLLVRALIETGMDDSVE